MKLNFTGLMMAMILTLPGTSTSARAELDDIYGKEKHKYVDVVRNGDRVGFFLKDRQNNTSVRVGSRDYTVDELIDLRRAERIDAIVTSIVDVAIIWGVGLYGGAALGTSLAESAMGGMAGITGVLMGAPGGALVTIAGVAAIDALNPIRQWRQVSDLAPEVIYDQDVYLNGSIDNFVDRLEVVLRKLD